MPHIFQTLVPAPVPGRALAVTVTVAVRRGVYRTTCHNNWAVPMPAASMVAVVLVCEVAACDGDCNYGQYDCRYYPFHCSLLSIQPYCHLRLYLYKATNAAKVTAFSRLQTGEAGGALKIPMDYRPRNPTIVFKTLYQPGEGKHA